MREIVVEENLVRSSSGNAYDIDCSSLADQNIRYVGEDQEGVYFVEREPFNGREEPENISEIEDLFSEAEEKDEEEKKEESQSNEDAQEAYFVYKTDVWRRTTEEEAEVLDERIQNSSTKRRRMWEDSRSIEHDSDYFLVLRDQMVEAFGEKRTDELLYPSNK